MPSVADAAHGPGLTLEALSVKRDASEAASPRLPGLSERRWLSDPPRHAVTEVRREPRRVHARSSQGRDRITAHSRDACLSYLTINQALSSPHFSTGR